MYFALKNNSLQNADVKIQEYNKTTINKQQILLTKT